ncbi:MAG: peptidoglycan recognition family protein [Planctomycetota bacterium]
MRNKSNRLSCVSGLGLGVMGLLTFHSAAADELMLEPSAVLLDRPAMVTAEQWGSEPQPIPDERLHTPEFVTVHHAGVTWQAGSDPAAKVLGLQKYGQNEKDWPDLPYHFLIAPDGTIFEGRPTEYEPETNTNYDVTGHVGIQLYGNFEEQRVSPAQMESLVQLTAWLLQEFELSTDTIGGHNDRPGAETSCPGRDLARYLHDGSLVGWVEATLAGEDVSIDLGDPLADGPTQMIPDAE